jgi:2-(1,2-epoxy-1,2-dihydrophenyl)acetyl-CoA isomerase
MNDILLLTQDGPVVTLTMNRPDAFNAFNWELMDALAVKLTELATDTRVRGIVLTGAGRAFCAGGDLKLLRTHPDGSEAVIHRLAARFHLAVMEMRRMAKPVIAAVNGAAAGGGFSLALAADFRVLGKSSILKCGYTSAGLTLDGGGTWTLTRMVGFAKALEIAALDAPISAEQALALGLATRVVEDDQIVPAAQELARTLAEKSMHSYGWTKRLLHDAASASLEAQLERERDGIAACGAHPDGQEGMAAFAEKRKPMFRG